MNTELNTETKMTERGALPLIEAAERLSQLKLLLPERHEPYTDKYFLRTNQILKAEGINPWVRAQVFLRGGPDEIQGMDEALAILDKYSEIRRSGGRIFAKEDGDIYNPLESIMIIEAPVQEIMELETMYLGVIAGETRRLNDGVYCINPDEVTARMQSIVKAAGGRPVFYLGARHARWDEDQVISRAAFLGGAAGASTDIGAGERGLKGMGTIPHALENIYAALYGEDKAVVEATKAFDRVIDPAVPRIALIDYNNREIDDAVATATALNGRLSAVRVDTCGENLAQGAFSSAKEVPSDHPLSEALRMVPPDDLRYWFGTGVTVSGVFALRRALDDAGHQDVQIVLTSGFGRLEKLEAFVRAEGLLKNAMNGSRLFDQLGVGKIFPSRTSTMDLVAVSDTIEGLDKNLISKAGRPYRPNNQLKLRLGGD